MVTTAFITMMTIYAYSVVIFYQSYANGNFGFCYMIHEDDNPIASSLILYKDTIECAKAALDRIGEIDNGKEETR